MSYVGHIRIVLWVSGSNGSTDVTHFQPWGQNCNLIHHHFTVIHISYAWDGWPSTHAHIPLGTGNVLGGFLGRIMMIFNYEFLIFNLM